MSRLESLEGGCSCGRNKYFVLIPQDANEAARVFFDNGHHHRRSQATPLSAWLRVPLEWYRSTTYAFFDDETHSSIRRTYTSPNEKNAKRHFCGFCGTPLSYWTESPPEEAEYISVTLGTLTNDKLRNLEELGILPKEATAEDEVREEQESGAVIPGRSIIERHQGLPWFDNMIEGSRLGKMKHSMGTKRSRDGNIKVEWEVVEWIDGDGEAPTSTKRKIGDMVESEDSTMRGSS